MTEPEPRLPGMTRWGFVRATINMAGLHDGQVAWIDLDDPQFQPLLAERYLVPEDPPAGQTGPA